MTALAGFHKVIAYATTTLHFKWAPLLAYTCCRTRRWAAALCLMAIIFENIFAFDDDDIFSTNTATINYQAGPEEEVAGISRSRSTPPVRHRRSLLQSSRYLPNFIEFPRLGHYYAIFFSSLLCLQYFPNAHAMLEDWSASNANIDTKIPPHYYIHHFNFIYSAAFHHRFISWLIDYYNNMRRCRRRTSVLHLLFHLWIKWSYSHTPSQSSSPDDWYCETSDTKSHTEFSFSIYKFSPPTPNGSSFPYISLIIIMEYRQV